MIEIKNLTMKYKNGKGVEDINITVDNGEVKGLLGPNGAGKSTTMRSLMGFLIPSQGTLSVEGINTCLLYTSPSPRDLSTSRMPSSA